MFREKCPICDNETKMDLWNGYVQCKFCKCTYIQEREETIDSYEQDYYFFNESHTRKHIARAYKQFKIVSSNISKGLKILDFGCGQAHFVNIAANHGYDCYGVDVSQNAIKEGRRRYPHLGAKLFSFKTLEELRRFLEAKQPFDVITVWEVIEHLEHPRNLITLLDIFLKLNGFFFLSTPNIGSFWVRTLKKRWHGFGIPEYHITYFTAQTLRALFDSLNYLPVVERTINPIWSHFFLLRNLAAAIADEYLQTQVKVIKASICAICLLPEKVAELVMPHLGMADTLIGCYRKVK